MLSHALQGPATQDNAGAVIRGLFQVPLVALATAAIIGVADLVATQGADALSTGAKREDDTQWVESLFKVESQLSQTGFYYDNVDDKELFSKIKLGTSEQAARKALQQRISAMGMPNAENVLREAVADLRRAPSEVVLDFQSALRGVRPPF